MVVNATKSGHLGFNSFWPSDTMWWQRSGSTLAQIMACCLTAINQSQPSITKIHLNYISEISFKFPRGQWVNCKGAEIWIIMPKLQLLMICILTLPGVISIHSIDYGRKTASCLIKKTSVLRNDRKGKQISMFNRHNSPCKAFEKSAVSMYRVQTRLERERERLSLSAFLRTEDIGVHIVHISRLIITYTLE